MSETKEYSTPELVKFLDEITILGDWERQVYVEKMLTQIKDILEQQYQHEQNILNYGTDEPDRVIDGRDGIPYKIPEKKQQPQPDDELIEHLHWMELQKDVNGFTEIHVDTIREILTLLQSRPSVTREEIEQWVTMLIGDYADNKEYFKQCVTMTVNLFKSKGVDVRGEK